MMDLLAAALQQRSPSCWWEMVPSKGRVGGSWWRSIRYRKHMKFKTGRH